MVTERLTVSITGITCVGCVSRIERALRDRNGVIWADVDFAGQNATVTYDPSVIVSGQLAEAIERLGYGASLAARPGTVAVRAQTPQVRSQALGLAKPVLAGLAASVFLVGLYVALVTIAQDWKHALELLWGDRWLVAAIAAGFWRADRALRAPPTA